VLSSTIFYALKQIFILFVRKAEANGK